MSTSFASSWPTMAPPWLRTGTGALYMTMLQGASDTLVDRAFQAMQIRLPGQGDASQLPYLAHDRALVQGPAETNAAFVARLKVAHQTWKTAGSAHSILSQLKSYISGLQPGVPTTNPSMAIVSGIYSTVTTWHTVTIGDNPSAPATVAQVRPSNFRWDGLSMPWRSWLIIYLAAADTGLSGSLGSVGAGSGGSLLGQNVNGVWVPGTSGTPVNSPFRAISGLTGLSSANVGMWLKWSGSIIVNNNGMFPITAVGSSSTCTIANPLGATDPGHSNWSVVNYPWFGPSPVWGAPGHTFGEGQTQPPPADTGGLFGGVWQPTTSATGYGTTNSFGLSVSPLVVDSIRKILKSWKSANNYFANIIVAFDGDSGVPGAAYSTVSGVGSGNPDGTFGDVGRLVNGVWVPTRKITSSYDAYCQGSGSYNSCSVENVT